MRHARELTLERRARTRLRGLVAVLTAGLLVAASLTALAVNRSRESQHLRDEASVLGLTGAALSNLGTDPELSVLLALHAIDRSASLGQTVPAETVHALHWAMHEAGVEYPVTDGPTAVAAGPFGIRGVFDLPLSQLANAARADVSRTLRSEECERFLGSSTCPLTSAFPSGLASEPVDVLPRQTDQPLVGTQVTLYAGNDQDRVISLRGEFEAFTAETGIEVRLVGNPNFPDYVATSLEAGDPPDVAVVGQPGYVRDIARGGSLIDLGTYMDVERLREDQSPYLISLGTIGDDGSWPASDGTTYGAFVTLSLKSMIWYPVPELGAEGYAIPQTWDELVELSDRLVRDGRTPWCMGWRSGPADGWPGTDWIEHLLLAEAGGDVYDEWTFHNMPFDSPPVRRAFERLDQVLFTDGYLAEGPAEVTWEEAQLAMVEEAPPGCWLYQFPEFASVALPRGSVGETTDFFPFPTIGPHGRGVIGGGEMLTVFSDRPEVRALVRYLLGPKYGATLPGASIHFISANQRFDLATYDPFTRHEAELINAALAEDEFRFDASDLMPPEIGAELFWGAMMRYATEGPESLDAILAELDAAWPDDG